MNKHNRHVRRYVLWIADVLVTLVTFFIAMWVRQDSTSFLALKDVRYVFMVIAAAGTAVSLAHDFNMNFMNRSNFHELVAVAHYNLYLVISVIFILFFSHLSSSLPRIALAYFWIINILAMYIERNVVKKTAIKIYGSSKSQRRIVIITDKFNLDKVHEHFSPGLTYRIIGTITADEHHADGVVEDKCIVSDTRKISTALVPIAVDDIFIDLPSVSKDTLFEVIEGIGDMGIPVHLAIDLPNPMGAATKATYFGDYLCMNYMPKEINYGALTVKRIFDVLGAVVGLLFTGVIAIFIVPAIKLDSPGPAIFSQTRIGRNGRRFKFYKFRSMYVDAEERKKELMANNEMNGLMFKMEDDPRVTKVGKFIRKTSLDEFPQFWNVFKGDMSLVGTRPPTEDEFLKYDEHYRKRLSMKPGITGLWQVSGRSEITDFDEVVKFDTQYIDNWSLSEDLRILVKTVIVVFKRKGAE